MRRLLDQLPIVRDPSTRRRMKQMPVIKQVRRASRKIRKAYYRHFGRYQLSRRLAATPRKRVVIGAWGRYDPDWIPTQREFLDLLQPADWERFFQPGSLEALLAEHVWEHLTPEQAFAAARTCFRYLRPGGYLRVAVPDGLHPDPAYVEVVKPGAQIENDHKVLYTYRTLRELFERAGFRVILHEYFDEAGRFQYQEWDQTAGTISRSKRFDPRNRMGNLASVYPGSLEDYLNYSSIVLDAFKEGPGERKART
jgi:predicted SAM-dependent methyltransferase